jgi:hypothetical protein
MTQALRRFSTNWIAKADAYRNNTLSDHFDKFTSLYVAFNALYMEVMTELVVAGATLPQNFKDKKAATDYVIQYLKGRNFIDNLLNDVQSVADIDAICSVIHQDRFNIILIWGVRQRQLDLELLTRLQATAAGVKSIAILELFYHIRCNMFHGHKGFEVRQSELLRPVNRLLRKTVLFTFNTLNQ